MRAALVAALAMGVAALDSPPKTHVTLVRVDVIASDARGRAVENLKPAEFELSEDGVPQTLDSVRFTKAAGQAPAEPDVRPIRSEFDEQEQAGRDGTRLFAILLDEYHVSAGASTERARVTLTHFVDRQLGPRDLVAVMKPLDSLFTIRMTRDRDEVRQAIETFQGRRGEYEPRNAFERNFIAGTPAGIEQLRTQVATSALNALVVHLGKLNEGRKSVVLVSEGLTSSVRRRGFETLPTIDAVIRAANRYNVSIYPIDPRVPAADQTEPRSTTGAKELETLRTLAKGTDGQAIVDAASLDTGLQQVAADSSAYYLLTYQSARPADGKFRDVAVRVKRAGVRVRARKGYWALWPDEEFVTEMLARGDAPPPSRFPPGFDVARRTSPLIQPWLGISRGDAGKVRVTFVWEPAVRVPGDRTRVGIPSRVVLKALGQDGAQAFDGAVAPASGSRVGPEDAARAVFDVPPGRLRLVIAIQDATAQQIDSDVRDVSVRDLKGPVALGTAEVLRTRTAREFQQIGADPAAVPTASREFSRTEHLIVRVPAYAPGGAPRVTARLLSRMGQAMRDLPVASPETPGGLFQFDVRLAGLAPGEYYIELSASSPAGEAKDLLGFRVTN